MLSMLDALAGPWPALWSFASLLVRRSAAALCGALLVAQPAAWAFGFEDVSARAHALAAAAYQPPVIPLSPLLRDLDYDAYRDIRFRPRRGGSRSCRTN